MNTYKINYRHPTKDGYEEMFFKMEAANVEQVEEKFPLEIENDDKKYQRHSIYLRTRIKKDKRAKTSAENGKLGGRKKVYDDNLIRKQFILFESHKAHVEKVVEEDERFANGSEFIRYLIDTHRKDNR